MKQGKHFVDATGNHGFNNPPERGDIECQEEETALCVVGEKENISHDVTRKRANKHCLTKKKIINGYLDHNQKRKTNRGTIKKNLVVPHQ